MNNNYFFYNNEKYIVEYTDKNIIVYKENNDKKAILSNEEIKRILNINYDYIYDSIILTYLSKKIEQLLNDNTKVSGIKL